MPVGVTVYFLFINSCGMMVVFIPSPGSRHHQQLCSYLHQVHVIINSCVHTFTRFTSSSTAVFIPSPGSRHHQQLCSYLHQVHVIINSCVHTFTRFTSSSTAVFIPSPGSRHHQQLCSYLHEIHTVLGQLKTTGLAELCPADVTKKFR